MDGARPEELDTRAITEIAIKLGTRIAVSAMGKIVDGRNEAYFHFQHLMNSGHAAMIADNAAMQAAVETTVITLIAVFKGGELTDILKEMVAGGAGEEFWQMRAEIRNRLMELLHFLAGKYGREGSSSILWTEQGDQA